MTAAYLALSSVAFVFQAGSVAKTDLTDQILETIDQKWSGSEWVNVSRLERLFSADGSRNGFLNHSWDGSGWVPTSGGRVVILFEGDQTAGRHSATWISTNSSGVYFALLETSDAVYSRKLMLSK